METKTLYSLLKEKDYQVRGDSERRKLQEACKEYMQENQQAIWYSDLHKGVSEYVKDLYRAGKIPKSEEVRKKRKKFLEWDIERYFKQNPDATISEAELREKLSNEYMNGLCKNIAFSEIEKSCKENSASFNVEDIYQILRKYNNILNYYTKMSVQPPIYLIDTSLALNDTNKRKFEELRQKGISLNNKRMGGKAERDFRTMEGIRTRYAKDYGILDSATSPIYYDFNPEKQEKFIAESISDNYSSLYREMDVLGNLAREYRNIATKLPIAYTDTKNAIDFFETDTGILLNKSKDESTVYEKFIFGK